MFVNPEFYSPNDVQRAADKAGVFPKEDLDIENGIYIDFLPFECYYHEEEEEPTLVWKR